MRKVDIFYFLEDVSYHVSFHTLYNDCQIGFGHHHRHPFWGPLRHLGDDRIVMFVSDVHVLYEIEMELKTKSRVHLHNSEAHGKLAQRGEKFQ